MELIILSSQGQLFVRSLPMLIYLVIKFEPPFTGSEQQESESKFLIIVYYVIFMIICGLIHFSE